MSYSSVLIVDDDPDVLKAARMLLKQHVELIETERNPQKIPYLLGQQSYDVIFLDMNFTRDTSSGKEGFYWLSKIMELDPEAVVVLITAYGDVEMSVKAIKEGATDFVLKPWQNEKLVATLSAALNLRKSRAEAARLRDRQQQLSRDIDQPFFDMIGKSESMQTVFSTIGKVSGTDANVLILGENGTGKELVARALHRQSQRSGEVFISVDIGAISESLFESELFGHVKGAFTDARQDRAGRFETASGGTLFLDEIGNIPLAMQAKLLTVIQNRQVTRLGSNKAIPIDVRLICATNMRVHEMSDSKEFRQDLLYRINTVEIQLPPLRERKDDINHLAEHFLSVYSNKYRKNGKSISQKALDKLKSWHWPGNVRELQHSIERAVIMSESDTIMAHDFLLSQPGGNGSGTEGESLNLNQVEASLIRKALKMHKGNISKAAQELGLTRAALYRRMEKHDL
ncbi:MAG: sigma-54 dependent transcriptional regulator [Balneolales bacterium]